MKFSLCFVALTVLLGNSVALAAVKTPLTINVRDFGAKGDGITDDAAAIQRAINEAAKYTQPYPRMWGAGYPEVIFPEGTYLISRTVVLGTGLIPGGGLAKGRGSNNGFSRGLGFTCVRGVGKVTIRQSNPNADIFYVGMAYKTLIENLSFSGGRHAVNLWTGNQDCAMPIIRHCRFADTGSYAIQTPYITRNAAGDFFGYSVVEADGSLREVKDPTSKHFLYHSTYLHIDDCEFINCMNVLFTVADMALMENSRIVTNPAMKGAAIRTGGLLKLYNVIGTARVRPGLEQRWIDVDFGATNWIVGEKLKFTTDVDQGLCVVYALDKFRRSGSYNPGAIVLRNSEFKVSGSPENALVYCREVPNLIAVSNCVQTGKFPVPVLGFPRIPDAAYFTGPNPARPLIVPNGLAFMIDDRNRNFLVDLPPSMRPYRRAPLSPQVNSEIAQLTATEKDAMINRGMFAKVDRTINAADFGLVGDGVTDDGDALQRVFDAVPQDGLNEVVFPGAIYFFNRTIRLPSRVVVRGSGRAVFMAPDQSNAGFRAAAARELAFLNCAMESGGRQFDFSIPRGVKARILFDNCSFANSCSVAVVCRSEAADLAERTANVIRISNSMFYNNRSVMDSDVCAILDSNWQAGYAASFRQGVNLKSKRSWEGANFRKGIPDSDPVRDICDVRNDGIMRAENICGVPMGKGWGRNFRWFDNSGTLFCDYFRFGGEQGGRRAVDVTAGAYKQKNIVIIQDSWLHHMTGAYHFPNTPEAMVPQSHMVYCAVIPDLLVLRDNIGMETSYLPHGVIGATVQTGNADQLAALRDRLFMSCNLIPENTAVRKTPEQLRELSSK